jgi:hypothetical protein
MQLCKWEYTFFLRRPKSSPYIFGPKYAHLTNTPIDLNLTRSDIRTIGQSHVMWFVCEYTGDYREEEDQQGQSAWEEKKGRKKTETEFYKTGRKEESSLGLPPYTSASHRRYQ